MARIWSNLVASDDTLVDICEKTYICIFRIATMWSYYSLC